MCRKLLLALGVGQGRLGWGFFFARKRTVDVIMRAPESVMFFLGELLTCHDDYVDLVVVLMGGCGMMKDPAEKMPGVLSGLKSECC
jgi:hypothetical protein